MSMCCLHLPYNPACTCLRDVCLGAVAEGDT